MKNARPRSLSGTAHEAYWGIIARPVQYVLDGLVLSAAFVFAYLVRFEFHLDAAHRAACLRQLPIVLVVQLLALLAFGVHAFIWRYVGMAEARTFFKAAVLGTVPLVALRLLLPESLQDFRIPLSITLIDAVLGFGGVLSVRVFRRFIYEDRQRVERAAHEPATPQKRVLLVGAGRAGILALKEILGRGDSDLNVRGFVDDDVSKRDSVIQGVRVLGTTADLPGLVKHLGIEQVVITIAQAPRKQIRKIVEVCESIPVKVRIMPGIWEILQGNVQVSKVRNVEIEDLLGRDPVKLEEEELRRFLLGRAVMVTGAGGSIGSELARQVARLGPRQLLLVERAEFALFDIDREIRRQAPDLPVVALVADVGERRRMEEIFRRFRPQIVVHAAAHKHVSLMEENPTEAVRNNVLATATLGRLAGDSGAEVFILISTDKAVRPTSIMGASKRIAELVVQSFDRCWPTRFLAVRFGNVLGSTGSVIPIFREQIRRGGPVTVTHPEMVRFFMTIPEASQLVLTAAAFGKGGEIFILDMGEPVRIVDLAADMITLSGLKPQEEIEIVFTGVRPGEKLAEEVGTAAEDVSRTSHAKIFQGRIVPVSAEFIELALERLEALVEAGDESVLREYLSSMIPDAHLNQPISPGAEVVPMASRRKERDSGHGTK
ncbi:MAG: polysaccharide biosynthesis protein [Thermoanaerobaculia bacterium]